MGGLYGTTHIKASHYTPVSDITVIGDTGNTTAHCERERDDSVLFAIASVEVIVARAQFTLPLGQPFVYSRVSCGILHSNLFA